MTAEIAAGPQFLMSAPRCGSHCGGPATRGACDFRVAWRINPHMRVGSVEPRRAARQHRALVELMGKVGARVEIVPFVHGAHDSVFIKDNALLVRRKGTLAALLTRPAHSERSLEQPARGRALHERGFDVRVDVCAPFEGGDVVMLPGGRGAVLGTGFRSHRSAADGVASFLDMPVHVVELRDPYLYHLDTAFAVLEDGTTAYCPEAFTAASRRWIQRSFREDSLLRVPYADARRFALNLIEVGDHVILGGPSPWLEQRLRERGLLVHVPSLRQFRNAGGSAACLVARVHQPTVTSSSTAAIRSTAA